MITKAIVEAIVNAYSFRVRIPVINRSKDAAFHTPTEELYISSICTVAGCIPNVRVGDIVYVSFEDNDLSKPVILGYLYKDSYGDTLCDFNIGNLTVDGSTTLSSDTHIGDVTPNEISYLQGAKSNIQWQLDLHEKDIEFLKTGSAIPLEQRQSDWNETDTNSPSYIRNKPTIPVVDTELTPDGTNPVAGGAIYDAIQAAGGALNIGEVSFFVDSQNPNRYTFQLTTDQINEIESSFDERDDIPITLYGTIPPTVGGQVYYFTVSKAMLRHYLNTDYMVYDGAALTHGDTNSAGVAEIGFASGGCYIELSMIGDAAGTLNTTNTSPLTPSASESLSGDINLHKVSKTGSYNDLNDTPTIPTVGTGVLTVQKNGTDVGTFSANATANKTINITVPTTAAEVDALPDTTKYGAGITVTIDNTDFKITTTLKDQDGNTLGTSQVIDLPLESVVVDGTYDSVNKKIVLTLQNGNTIDIPVGDLISGLQTEITAQNPLDADLVDDSTSTHKFTTASDISKLAGIEAGAEVNVQSDWSQSDSTADDYIKNKPTISSTVVSGSTDLVTSDGIYQADENVRVNSSLYYVPGEDSIASASYKSAIWCGYNAAIPSQVVVGDESHYYAGLTINYKIDVAGNASYGVLLRLNDEDYEHPVVTNVDTLIGTRYAVGCILTLTYDPTYNSATVGSGQYYYVLCAKNALGTSTTDPTVDGATLEGHTEWVQGDSVLYDNIKYVLVRHENKGANWIAAASKTATYVRFFLKGAWKVSDYDTNTNTIGYQLRTNSTTLKTTDACRYYKIFFTSADNTHWVPSSSDTANSATSKKLVNQRAINPFGEIVYCSATTSYAAEANIAAATIWQQYILNLGYSFNTTGSALTLTVQRPVYVRCTPQSNGSAIIDEALPIVQQLPTTEDGKIYIFLGVAYGTEETTATVEMTMNHPIYFFKNGAIRQWTNVAPTEDTNTVPSAYCTTDASVASKEAVCTGYVKTANTYLHIDITVSNTAQSALTLNVNSTGATPITINGEVTSSTNYTLPAGTYIAFYDGVNYQFRTDGVIPGAVVHSTSSDSVPWTGITNRPTLSHVYVEQQNGENVLVAVDV